MKRCFITKVNDQEIKNTFIEELLSTHEKCNKAICWQKLWTGKYPEDPQFIWYEIIRIVFEEKVFWLCVLASIFPETYSSKKICF